MRLAGQCMTCMILEVRFTCAPGDDREGVAPQKASDDESVRK